MKMKYFIFFNFKKYKLLPKCLKFSTKIEQIDFLIFSLCFLILMRSEEKNRANLRGSIPKRRNYIVEATSKGYTQRMRLNDNLKIINTEINTTLKILLIFRLLQNDCFHLSFVYSIF